MKPRDVVGVVVAGTIVWESVVPHFAAGGRAGGQETGKEPWHTTGTLFSGASVIGTPGSTSSEPWLTFVVGEPVTEPLPGLVTDLGNEEVEVLRADRLRPAEIRFVRSA